MSVWFWNCRAYGQLCAITSFGKVVLTLCMLLGRLELFTLLVLLQPEFWKSKKSGKMEGDEMSEILFWLLILNWVGCPGSMRAAPMM
jgi:hypothetical protein